MYHQPIKEDSETGAPAPMRGLLIAAPVALVLWAGVAVVARLFV